MTLCFECDSPAEEQHHPIPQSLGGKRTIPLCSPCHGRAHQVSRGSIPALTKLALQKRKEAGVRLGRPRNLFPETVARIVYLHDVEKMSQAGIARLFTEEGIPTAQGGTKWWPSTINGVLKSHRLDLEYAELLEKAAGI